MTLSEFRSLLKGMSEEQKDAFLIEYFKRQNKQDKEMFAILIECSRDQKEMPAKNMKIVDVAKLEKKFETFQSSLYKLYYGRPGIRRRLKKTAKEIISALALMPVQAAEYDKACELYTKFLQTVSVFSYGAYGLAENYFTDLGLSVIECFTQLMSMVFAKGNTPDEFEWFAGFYGKCLLRPDDLYDEMIVSAQIPEQLVRRVSNGDLRFELIERIEKRLEEQKTKEELTDGEKRGLAVFYLLLCRQEETFGEGCTFLSNALGKEEAHTCVLLIEEAFHLSKEEEQSRIRSL